MYTKILAPLDGSKFGEQVLPYVRIYAEMYRIPVVLLHVQDPDIRVPFWPPLATEEYLQQASGKYLAPSMTVDHVLEVGKAAEVIVDRARDDPACLIALATHGLSGARRWLLGSVASKVAHTTTNPLLFIRPSDTEEPVTEVELKTVFVPLDGSALAEKVLPHVIELARKINLEVQLVRVYSVPPDAYVVGAGVYPQAFVGQKDAIQKEAETYLDGKVEELRAEGVTQVLSTAIAGDPAGEIIDLAQRTPKNMIAMSSHGRSGLAQWVLGSVAEKVIHHSRDPVLVIRPTA